MRCWYVYVYIHYIHILYVPKTSTSLVNTWCFLVTWNLPKASPQGIIPISESALVVGEIIRNNLLSHLDISYIWGWLKTSCYHTSILDKEPWSSYFQVPRVPGFWLIAISEIDHNPQDPRGQNPRFQPCHSPHILNPGLPLRGSSQGFPSMGVPPDPNGRFIMDNPILVGVVYPPLWKIWLRQLGWGQQPNISGKIKNDPNHQPALNWMIWGSPHLYPFMETTT